jgi:transposase
LAKNMRRTLGNWNLRHWLTRLEQRCEDNRVVFRSVPAAYTSQTCPVCSHVERGNRLSRFLLGPYGAEFKHVVA